MKEFEYEFITGELVVVKVDDTLWVIIKALNDEDENNNRTETRRHKSLEKLEQMGVQFSASTDVVAAVEQFIMQEKLYQALAKLKPEQRQLLHVVYSEGRSLADIAREENVKYQSIQDRVQKIIAKLTKFLLGGLRLAFLVACI